MEELIYHQLRWAALKEHTTCKILNTYDNKTHSVGGEEGVAHLCQERYRVWTMQSRGFSYITHDLVHLLISR